MESSRLNAFIFSVEPIFARDRAPLKKSIEASYTPRSTGYGWPSLPPWAKLNLTGSLKLGLSP